MSRVSSAVPYHQHTLEQYISLKGYSNFMGKGSLKFCLSEMKVYLKTAFHIGIEFMHIIMFVS